MPTGCSRPSRSSGLRRRTSTSRSRAKGSVKPWRCCCTAGPRSELSPMSDADKNRHDFKNQLAIIRGFAEILVAEAAADDPRRPDLEEIHKAAVAALALLERVFPDPSNL